MLQNLRWLTIDLENMKMIFAVVGLIGILLFASPTILLLVKGPSEQQFSEIYILGSNHTFDNLPFNVKAGVAQSVYLGIVNNMGSSSYYTCLVKLANDTELPSTTSGIPRSLPPLFEYKTFLKDGETFEVPLTFQVNALSFVNGTCTLSNISVNGVSTQVDKVTLWNSEKTGYFYNLFVELWLFDSSRGISQFDDRFVSLNLNMTA